MFSSLCAALAGLGVFLLAQAASPTTPDDIWRLGVIAIAVLVGAAVSYRYTTLPERAAREKAEQRAEDAERDKVEAYKITLPAVLASNDLANRVLAVLPGVEALIAPKRHPQ